MLLFIVLFLFVLSFLFISPVLSGWWYVPAKTLHLICNGIILFTPLILVLGGYGWMKMEVTSGSYFEASNFPWLLMVITVFAYGVGLLFQRRTS